MTTTTGQAFVLTEGASLADLYEVDDGDLSAAQAITEALTGPEPVIESPRPVSARPAMAVDALADGDGDIDGYRILVRMPGAGYYLASEILHVSDLGGDDAADATMAVLEGAVDAANQIVADFEAAAAKTALAHHVEAAIEDMPDPFRYCKTCSGHPAWPCPEVRDITAALAGQSATPEPRPAS